MQMCCVIRKQKVNFSLLTHCDLLCTFVCHMAGILKIVEFRKRFVVAGAGGLVALPPVVTVFRRYMHESVYQKNVEDYLNATTVQDEVIKSESDKYWSPNPSTGVFGPGSGTQSSGTRKGPSAGSQNSVLEETAWFRPTSLEDLEKAT